jgi:class 3 adenylate cyclase
MATLNEAMNADIRDVLPVVVVPTLVIHREGDQWYDSEHGRYLAEHIPGARYVEVPGDDHVPYLGDAEPILTEIEEFVTGARRMREPDRILATLLFTDIVGSTQEAARRGDRAWRELLDRHDEMVRLTVDRFRGREVNTTGDGFLVLLDGPARAVQCARAIREGTKQIGLSVRAGLHTGEVECRGEDVGGIAMHVGARVSALASADEILVSSTVVDLVAGSGLQFDDRGDHELKGVGRTWRIYALAEPR